MASHGSKRSAPPQELVDAIPMQKTNPLAWVGAGGGVVLMVGAIVWASSGGDEQAEQRARELKEGASQVAAEPNRLSAKEQQEHLKVTQRALERVEEPEQGAPEAPRAEPRVATEPAPEPRGASSPPPAAAVPAPAAAPVAAPAAAPAAAPPPEKPAPPPKAVKKELDALDSMGSDIANALE